MTAADEQWQIVCADSVEWTASHLDAGSVDHVITDPPYGAETHTRHRWIHDRGGG